MDRHSDTAESAKWAIEGPDSKKVRPLELDQSSTGSTPASFFDRLYEMDPDPWDLATSRYEEQKYHRTVAALPKPHYRSALEIGCSIGVLTRLLATRCESLLAIDCAQRALDIASVRCAELEHVRFERLTVPDEFPSGRRFDLIVLSEVAYYLCATDLARLFLLVVEHLERGGHVVLVHWVPPGPGKPLTGAEVHEALRDQCGQQLVSSHSVHTQTYWIDVFERV